MDTQLDGFTTIAAMLGVDGAILRSVAMPWIENPAHPPLSLVDFVKRMEQAEAIAKQLNNTNLWEQAIVGALPTEEIPPTLPTAGVARSASDSPPPLIYSEVMGRFIVAMDPKDMTRAAPGSVFRFGKLFSGRPSVEIYQRHGATGAVSMIGTTEDAVRAALMGVGFIEAKRYNADPEQGNVTLEHIANIIAKGEQQ